VGLFDDPARNDLTIFHGDLTGHMQPAIGLDRPRKWQPLATRTRLFRTVPLDGHQALLCKLFSSIVDKSPQKTHFDQTKTAIMKTI
jgi:hypothetical protein